MFKKKFEGEKNNLKGIKQSSWALKAADPVCLKSPACPDVTRTQIRQKGHSAVVGEKHFINWLALLM